MDKNRYRRTYLGKEAKKWSKWTNHTVNLTDPNPYSKQLLDPTRSEEKNYSCNDSSQAIETLAQKIEEKAKHKQRIKQGGMAPWLWKPTDAGQNQICTEKNKKREGSAQVFRKRTSKTQISRI